MQNILYNSPYAERWVRQAPRGLTVLGVFIYSVAKPKIGLAHISVGFMKVIKVMLSQ